MSLAENIAHALGYGKEKRNRDGWLTCCPAHGDAKPSLSIKDGTDKNGSPDVFVYCQAGCDFKAVKDELRVIGLLPEWEPKSCQCRPLNGIKTYAEDRKTNPAPSIWKRSKSDADALEIFER
ncbi:hypothetical protein [Candidatus Electronema sp. JM]|uniref:hypothetical protein n=1 Tax=Candidatus Electronema sp. JM TaxID=3401571 RepID=UPI003AA8CB75